MDNSGPNPAAAHIAVLLTLFRQLEAGGASNPTHPEHDKRNQTLDELQDAVGLEGRMVMEKDIVKRAEKFLGSV